MDQSRTPDIMADSAYVILTSKASKTTDNFFMDDEVLASVGISDLSKYNPSKGKVPDLKLQTDFLC